MSEPKTFAALPDWLVKQLLAGPTPTSVLDKMEGVQPMSKEAFDAYKQLAADKTWSYGRCNFIMRNKHGSQKESSTEEKGNSD